MTLPFLPLLAVGLGTFVAIRLLWDDIWTVEPDYVAYADADGYPVELPVPYGVTSDDIWQALAWIESLPEVQRV